MDLRLNLQELRISKFVPHLGWIFDLNFLVIVTLEVECYILCIFLDMMYLIDSWHNWKVSLR